MKIAIIGTGIAGNVAAYHLRRKHEITVFESNPYVGGHTNTVDVSLREDSCAIDTGFIVFNDRTYPEFVKLLNELRVDSQATRMSFSVSSRRSGLEYNGTTLNSLFAQRRNLFRPSFHRMIGDILRFNRTASAMLDGEDDLSLGEYFETANYSREFIDHYIVPMGAAIWSAAPSSMVEMPAKFFVRFFAHHGMLSIDDRPTWRVIKGGSRSYVDKLVAGHRERIQLSNPVQWVRRLIDGVALKSRRGGVECFDQVFFACHSDEALALLLDPSPLERRVLGAMRYQQNEAVLHTDAALMPRARRAWAAWNYHGPGEEQSRVAVTYNMNILQGLSIPEQFCVTLNNTGMISPGKIVRRIHYTHPVFNAAAIAVQGRQRELNGVARSYYCGAYWRNGFHEDGVVSALSAVKHFEERNAVEKLYLRRTG